VIKAPTRNRYSVRGSLGLIMGLGDQIPYIKQRDRALPSEGATVTVKSIRSWPGSHLYKPLGQLRMHDTQNLSHNTQER
jgi:hypothetical protein